MEKSPQTHHRFSSFWQMLRTSNYYTAVLLILTYILFAIAPMLWLATGRSSVIYSKGFLYVILTITFSDTCDALIYVWKLPCVKKLLIQKLRVVFPCCYRHVGVTEREMTLARISGPCKRIIPVVRYNNEIEVIQIGTPPW